MSPAPPCPAIDVIALLKRIHWTTTQAVNTARIGTHYRELTTAEWNAPLNHRTESWELVHMAAGSVGYQYRARCRHMQSSATVLDILTAISEMTDASAYDHVYFEGIEEVDHRLFVVNTGS